MNGPLSLGHRLRQLLAALDGDVQQVYDALGVDFRPRFFPIVRSLIAASPQRVGDLAAAIGVSQPAATQTIGEMVRAGLISLAPGADRRAREVALTAEGARLADRLGPVWAGVEAAAAALDGELDQPLSACVDQALAALRREPFRDRVRKAMT